ncbi:MAG TPA: Trp biosynthesis-associated membrane protein [Microlunatus sp.]
MSRLTRLTGRGPTLVLLLLGAGLGFVAAAQAWWRAGGAGAEVTFSGSDATGGLSQALAAVALAGVLLVLVLRRRGRRVLAVALAATGVGMIVTGAVQTAPDAEAVRNRVRQVSLTDQFALETTAWPWVYAVAGVAVLFGGLLLWRGAARWAERSDRFERSVTPGTAPADLSEDPGRAWKDLDAGLDPTGDPDVHDGAESVTMEPIHDPRQE